MNTIEWTATALIVAGVLGLAVGGFSYTQETHEAKIRPLALSVKEQQTVDVPLWAAALICAAAIALIAVGAVAFAVSAIRDAFREHQVLFFPRQNLSPDDLVAAASRFGEIDPPHGGLRHHPDNPNVMTAITVKGERHINRLQRLDDQRVLALGNGGQVTVVEWTSGQVHTDVVTDGPDLFAASAEGNNLTLASSAGLIQHALVTPEMK